MAKDRHRMTPAERNRLLYACRVPVSVPMGEFGVWILDRVTMTDGRLRPEALPYMNGWATYVILGRFTEAKMHLPHGDIVMIDHALELMKHLPILMNATGRVLITGLGLGCVVRGLLTREQVDHVDVIELDRRILDRIGPEFDGNDRVTLHHADAFKFPLNGQRWDWAWHDISDETEPLQRLHADLMLRFLDHVKRQSAWEMPRWVKRRLGGQFFENKKSSFPVI
jgi:hypothetical protein